MSLHLVTTNKSTQKHIEGDVWEEGGKTWTIKNGIKRTLTKMDNARKAFLTPLACPKCNSSMNHRLDEKMWNINKTCFNCMIDMEHEIMKAGKWAEYEKAKITANAEAWCKEFEAAVGEFVQSSVAKSHVTEDGMIENWRDVGKDFITKVAEKEVTELKEKIEKYKNNDKA